MAVSSWLARTKWEIQGWIEDGGTSMWSQTLTNTVRSCQKIERERVSVQTIVNNQLSAREWILSIICMLKLQALKPTERYLHLLYSHLQKAIQEWQECWLWERDPPCPLSQIISSAFCQGLLIVRLTDSRVMSGIRLWLIVRSLCHT